MDPLASRGTDRRPWGLLAAACCALAAYGALYTLGNLRTHLLRFDAMITVGMAVAVLGYRAWDALAGEHESRAVRVVIVSAVIVRVALLWLQPSLSDDLYRYAWDGHLLAHGVNPYAQAPSDDGLRALRNDAYPRIAYKEYHSIYPPLAEAGMGAAAWLSENIFDGGMRTTFVLWKLLLIGAECCSMIVIARLLMLWKLPARGLVLYAWHPLPIVEFAGQGHSDALMIAAMLLCLYLFARSKTINGLAAYAVAIAARGVPLLFAPAIARISGWTRTVTAIVAGAALILPFLSSPALQGMMASTRGMGQSFVFNSFGFWILYGALELVHGWAAEPFITTALAVMLITGLIWQAARSGALEPRDLPRALTVTCTLATFLLWNMHPWYFSWGLSLVPFTLSWGWAWIGFASLFTYVHYTPRSDAALLAVGIAEYGVFIALLWMQRRFSVARNGRRG